MMLRTAIQTILFLTSLTSGCSLESFSAAVTDTEISYIIGSG